ncbi:M48 family metallopeptidase, partial [Aliarcobacter butzleri]
SYTSDKALYDYVMDFKNEYFKKYQISKVLYDGKINVINNALGMHTFVSRVQGGKLKSKNEIRVATIFKNMPKEFLKMIVVHELSHFKEKEHNKSFYDMCCYMMPNYHQMEFDLRVYLTHIDKFGKIY